MPIHCVTNSDGIIINRIVSDENTPEDWSPGDNLVVHPPEVVGDIGGTIIDGVYTPPPAEESNED